MKKMKCHEIKKDRQNFVFFLIDRIENQAKIVIFFFIYTCIDSTREFDEEKAGKRAERIRFSVVEQIEFHRLQLIAICTVFFGAI